ncbi:unnamed protein product [Dibothriocephalus latus]|uniref:Uncharacterized protein n=1 Tax=Dibothriocephalus latus TaxID=60516 RepID=A0A3P7LMR4_DIBLA|nr:unnamed protein product [Dibothriocephalus latus]
MALNTKPPDFEEMDIYKLNQALEKQLFLLNNQKLLTVRGEEPSSKSTSAGCTTTESEVDSLVSTLELLNLSKLFPIFTLSGLICCDTSRLYIVVTMMVVSSNFTH